MRAELEVEELEFKGGIYLAFILSFLILGFFIYNMGTNTFIS